jgi:fructokinase
VLVAGVELGGTKCVCVVADGTPVVREETRIETRDPTATLAEIATVLGQWRETLPIRAVGVASFGPLDLDAASPRYGHMLATPKPGWSGVDVLGALRIGPDVPVALDTDVNGAALAEGRWGAARGLDHYVYVTVGTGIGVGSIVHGRAIRGAGHSEAGHLRVPRLAGDDWPGVCPFHGDCVEGLASGPAIAARAGRPAETLTADDSAWTPVVHALAAMLHNLVLTTAPRRIVLGGGIVTGQPHLLPRLRRTLAESLAGYAHAALVLQDADRYVTTPALGERAGPLGAVALGVDAARRDSVPHD